MTNTFELSEEERDARAGRTPEQEAYIPPTDADERCVLEAVAAGKTPQHPPEDRAKIAELEQGLKGEAGDPGDTREAYPVDAEAAALEEREAQEPQHQKEPTAKERQEFNAAGDKEERAAMSPEKDDTMDALDALLDKAELSEGDPEREKMERRARFMTQEEIAFLAYDIEGLRLKTEAHELQPIELSDQLREVFKDDNFSREGRERRSGDGAAGAHVSRGEWNQKAIPEDVRTDEHLLAEHGREYFGDLVALAPERFKETWNDDLKDHFLRYLGAKLDRLVAVHDSGRDTDEKGEGAYIDNIGTLLGPNSPELFIFRALVREKDGAEPRMNEVLRMPLSEAIERYLGVSVRTLSPDFDEHFHKRLPDVA